MATYTYKGTKITGTSTTAKVFSKSGVTNAKKNQTYLNTSTGHVYTCTTAGNAKTAKWKYTRTDVVAKPSVAVTSLAAPARQSGNRKMKATWKTPAALVDTKKGDRATDLTITWWLGIEGTDPKSVVKTANEKLTEHTINLDSLTIGKTTYKRNSFYPFTKKHLTYVTVQVQGRNAKGTGKAAKVARKFTVPRAPSIGAPSFNADTGSTSFTITTNAGADYAERYDTRYKMTVKNTRTGKTWTQTDKSSTSTEFNISYDASDYQQLSYGQYIQITVEAWARGYAGDSKHVTRTFYVAYPAQPTIQSVSVSSKDSTGKCTVGIKTNSSAAHPVDQVRLEYLADCTYATVGAIPASADWKSSDIVDNASCTAMAIGVSEIIPERGHYTWIRIKAYHASENVLYRYSAYRRVTALETPAPTAADDEITILSATAGENGDSIVLFLGWNADGQDDSTGTEITWSDEEDSWKSTKEPERYTFEWSDGRVTEGGVTYRDSAKIVIKGLSEGEKYYIRARRYLEGDTTSYSPYSNTATCITSEKPATVVAVCDRYVALGASLPVRWTFSATSLQSAWQIVTTSGTVIASGEGSLGSTQISAERLLAFATDNVVTFTVQASTGSGFVVSEEHTVTIIEAPDLVVTANNPLTVQPFTFSATASELSDLVIVVTSQGASGQFPVGQLRQTEGDTIYSGVVSPVWETTGTGYATDVTIPVGLDFWDGGLYTLTVTAIDRSTGLTSGEKSLNFSVAWEHQAPEVQPQPTYTLSTDTEVNEDKNYYSYNSETQTYSVVDVVDGESPKAEGWYEESQKVFVTLTAENITDDDGTHHQRVQIALTPPDNAAETDLYDIYRMTGDGAVLIGESFPLTYTATDEYAPFSPDITQHYRIAIRTIDGDVAFSDFEYDLEGDAMRFDWAGGSLELPYNLSIGDTYTKDVEIRNHMDGSIGGYWNQNINRKGSLSSDVIRLIQQADIDLARALARYPGAVFVRTPDGSAYEADVQVTDLSIKNPAVTAIAVDANEISLTDEFRLPTPYRVTDEPEENEENQENQNQTNEEAS